MALRPCADPSAATWIADSALPWQRLATLGPAGFAAYARLRFLPDPDHPGQSENDVEVGPDAPTEHERLAVALEVLRGHTTTPEEVYCCLWDGWGWSPAGGPSGGGSARVRIGVEASGSEDIAARAYFLLRGTLSDVGAAWELEGAGARQRTPAPPDPAFVWPADHAWCVAKDVDPHYAGIGGSTAAVAQLVATRGLDVVPIDPEAAQPSYR